MKKFFVSIFTIIGIICIAFDLWYLTVYQYGDEAVVGQTFYIGEQEITYTDAVTGVETSESRYFCEIAIWNNCFEIKFNQVMDETNSNFYSTGIQFFYDGSDGKFSQYLKQNYTENDDNSVNINYTILETLNYTYNDDNSLLKKYHYTYYDAILYNKTYENITVTEYSSADDFETVTESIINMSDTDVYFKVLIGDENYVISPKFDNTDFLTENKAVFYIIEQESESYKKNIFKEHYFYETVYYYRVCDMYFIAEMLYSSCSSLNYSSTAQVITFNLGDYFDYYKLVDESTGRYEKVSNDSSEESNLISLMNSYFQIKVYKYNADMTSSSQSLFNCVKGSTTYDSDPDSNDMTDYFIGRTIYELTENDFILIYENNKYYLNLNEDFIKSYSDYKNSIRLKIDIDFDEFSKLGITELYLNTGEFNCFMLNDKIINITLDNYILEVE